MLCSIFVAFVIDAVCAAYICEEIHFLLWITWWSGDFKVIYLHKVVCYQQHDKRKLISSKSQLILGSPMKLLMWFRQCCDLPVRLACLAMTLTADYRILQTVDFMALHLCRTQCLTCEIKVPIKFSEHFEVDCNWFTSYFHCFCLFTAPSTVSIMHQVSRTVDSITLSWSQPDQPNGVILDYELQYYEKVQYAHIHSISFTYYVSSLIRISISFSLGKINQALVMKNVSFFHLYI